MSLHDLWKGKRSGPGKRWQVRYREAGRQRKRNFDTKEAALTFEARSRLEPDQRLAQEGRHLSVSAMMDTWLATKTDRARKTQEAYTYDVGQVTAAFGGRLATSLRSSEIRVWVARSGTSVSVRRRSLTALQAAYGLAIEDELLGVDPTSRIKLPRAVETERRFLSWSELAELAKETGTHESLVWLLGTSGLRLGEAAGLQVGDVRCGKLRVARQRHGSIVESPKGGRGRDVPVARFVLEQLELRGRKDEEWLFRGSRSDRLDTHAWRSRVFQPAATRTVGAMVPHELRHTAASLAIASGANVKQVQNMLGHRSATITLDLYGHLWNDDTVATSMDDAYRSILVKPELSA